MGKFVRLKTISLAFVSAGLLTVAGCGGGGGSSGGGGTTDTTMTVAPSLGRFSEGTKVRLHKPDGVDLVIGALAANGKYTGKFSGYTGPVVVEVQGGAGVTYYDERTGKDKPFVAGKTLRAVMPAPQLEVGVSALTNAAVVKLAAATGGLAAVDTTKILDANAKIAAASGLGGASILQAPTLVDANTGKTLNVATAAGKYALLLAAFARTATGTATAMDVAEAFAQDMKDDKLDGLDGTSSTPNAVLANAPTPTALIALYTDAAGVLATAESNEVIKAAPLVPTVDVTQVTGDTTSPVNLAKALFAELRTTLNSFSNLTGTGFLDTQASRASDDLAANVAPDLGRVANRIDALSNTIGALEDVKQISGVINYGFVTGVDPSGTISGNVLVRQLGNYQQVWMGYGSFEYCWTNSITPANITKVSCVYANPDSVDWANSLVKLMVIEVTGAGTNSYTYTATRRNKPVGTTGNYSWQNPDFTQATTTVTAPVGSGTLVQVFDTNSVPTSLTISGTFPPSAGATGALATTADTIAVTATRSALTGSNYRYALTGSVSTALASDTTKVVTLKFDTGSYIDADETNAFGNGNQSGALPIAARLIGVAQTAATKFTGTIDMGSFATDVNNSNRSPTSMSFTGVISDLTTGGAGAFLTGQLSAAVTGYSSFDANIAEDANNYLPTSVTFTGTVQAPGSQELKLVLAGTRPTWNTNSVTLTYSYGAAVKITGSATVDANTGVGGSSLTLTNQDGIDIILDNAAGTGTVKKAGTTLANIANGSINYTDGVTESLN